MSTPVEEKTIAIDNEGEAPGLTDTGEHDLTAISREPAIVAAAGDQEGRRQARRRRPDQDPGRRTQAQSVQVQGEMTSCAARR